MKNRVKLSDISFIRFLVKNGILISILYILFIIFIAYITTGFKFQNNNSIIFIILLLIVPINIFIFTVIIKNSNKKRLLLNKTNLKKVLDDNFDNGDFIKLLIDPLKQLTDVYYTKMSNGNIYVYCGINSNIVITIDKKCCIIKINNTGIKYGLYFYNDIYKKEYDINNLNNYSSSFLYSKIIEIVSNLLNKTLSYIEYSIKNKVIGYKLIDEEHILFEQYDGDINNYLVKSKSIMLEIK